MKLIMAVLSIFFFINTSLGQTPIIDSITVDEDKSELILSGKFPNLSSTIVTVDSFSLPVISFSDSLIRASIPLEGKGSAGWVKVNNGSVSNPRLLTYVHFQVFNAWNDPKDYNFPEWRSLNSDTINVRADFADMSKASKHILSSSASSRCHDLNGDGGCPLFDSSGILHAKVSYDVGNRLFSYVISFCNYGGQEQLYSFNINLDKNFTPINGHDPYESRYDSIFWGAITATDFPPSIDNGVHEVQTNSQTIHAQLSCNPVTSNGAVSVNLQEQTDLSIKIMNILGEVVFSDRKLLPNGINKITFNSSAIKSGVYLCWLQTDNAILTLRFVKN